MRSPILLLLISASVCSAAINPDRVDQSTVNELIEQQRRMQERQTALDIIQADKELPEEVERQAAERQREQLERNRQIKTMMQQPPEQFEHYATQAGNASPGNRQNRTNTTPASVRVSIGMFVLGISALIFWLLIRKRSHRSSA